MPADHGKMAPSIASVPRVNSLFSGMSQCIDGDLVPLRENKRASSRVNCIAGKCTERIVGDIYL